jgi:hypothetical protein
MTILQECRTQYYVIFVALSVLLCVGCEKCRTNENASIATGYTTNEFGYTSLHLAAIGADSNLVESLLTSGTAYVDESNLFSHETALTYAVAKGNDSIVKTLLKFGANPDLCNNQGRSALDIAAYEGSVLSLDLLLKAKANVNDSDKFGLTPLFMVLMNNDENAVKAEKIRMLILAGANPLARCENEDGFPDSRIGFHQRKPVFPRFDESVIDFAKRLDVSSDILDVLRSVRKGSP